MCGSSYDEPPLKKHVFLGFGGRRPAMGDRMQIIEHSCQPHGWHDYGACAFSSGEARHVFFSKKSARRGRGRRALLPAGRTAAGRRRSFPLAHAGVRSRRLPLAPVRYRWLSLVFALFSCVIDFFAS